MSDVHALKTRLKSALDESLELDEQLADGEIDDDTYRSSMKAAQHQGSAHSRPDAPRQGAEGSGAGAVEDPREGGRSAPRP